MFTEPRQAQREIDRRTKNTLYHGMDRYGNLTERRASILLTPSPL